ncbi:lytic transglycosylase domain-containing protein [Roseicella sp. DB1501]|uniref:lytic transglycosylase domain-containing protein n=1 Tax=Roseicella sp. DB1501 TaxID=2730925 RepID=UPI0014910206|nr:lytic transglycosylase domain-containing protein [Roseicella sp. DB1501]NOG73263.1 lytic transglycosylase domain-containing protein [Roseicella sp. DB1501]
MHAFALSLLFLALVPVAQAQLLLQAPDQGQLCRAAILRAEQERGLPPRLLAAIGRVESGRRDPQTGSFAPWPWTINAEGRGSFFPDKAAAIAAVRALQAQGVRSIDVGCMQINLRHHPDAFASLEEAFDPLANARYAARFLSEMQATRGDWMLTASHYHSQTPAHAEPYRARIAAAMLAEQQQPDAPPPPAAFAALTAPPAMPSGTPPAPRPPLPAPLPAGGAMLRNGPARILPMPASAGAGRGLDAYRAMPIPLVGRFVAAPRRGL